MPKQRQPSSARHGGFDGPVSLPCPPSPCRAAPSLSGGAGCSDDELHSGRAEQEALDATGLAGLVVFKPYGPPRRRWGEMRFAGHRRDARSILADLPQPRAFLGAMNSATRRSVSAWVGG